MKKIYACLVTCFLFLGLYATNLSPWRLGYNRTDSLPLGLYLAHRAPQALERGDYVCFRYREPSWAVGRYLPDGAQLCKEVLGLPGDTVLQEQNALYLVHGGKRAPLGSLLSADSKGRAVPVQSWGTTVIPPGQFYLGSTRIPTSFDSRYLGLISQSDILARIYPLLTF